MMKKILYFAIAAALLTGCKDDFDNKPQPTPTPGVDVEFATVVGDEAESRTQYADYVSGNSWQINWLNGDLINVYTPTGPDNYKLAPYKIVNETEDGTPIDNQNYANKIQKLNDSGVRWGQTLPQAFYAVYPYVASTSSTQQITGSGDNVKITATVAANQFNSVPPVSVTPTGETKTTTFVKGDMANNVMYACTPNASDPSKPVDLRFIPLSTVVQFRFNGLLTNVPEGETTGTAKDMRIRKVTLTAPEGTNIAGTLEVTGITTTQGTSAAAPTISVSNGSNSVSVNTVYDNTYLVMKANETMTVNMFLAIPTTSADDRFNMVGWTLTVEGENGTFRRTFSKANTSANTKLTQGKIHLINLPAFTTTGDWQYDPECWMKDIPDNVYFTELSLPGTWYSDASSTSREQYQGSNISTQFKSGVRSFYFETRVTVNGDPVLASNYPEAMQNNSGSRYSYVGLSGYGHNFSGTVGINWNLINAYGNQTSGQVPQLSSYIEDIIDLVTTQKGKSEFAVINIAYSDGGQSGVADIWKSYWLEKIKYSINNMSASYKKYIYGFNEDGTLPADPTTIAITPNTTLGDLRGKVILKINIDKDVEVSKKVGPFQAGGVEIFGELVRTTTFEHQTPANICNDIPALFSFTTYDWTNISGGVTSQLTWRSTPNLANEPAERTDFSTGFWCSYTIANRTLTNSGQHPSASDREAAIKDLIDESSTYYQGSNHNMYYMIGAGGTRATTRDAEDTESGGPTTVANNLNPIVKTKINEKVTNNKPSPLGSVLINFANTQTGVGDDNIPNIIPLTIEMNNKFYLKRAEPTPESRVTSAAPGYSSGMVDNNQNAISF